MGNPNTALVLRVSFGAREITTARADQLPVELQPNISWSGRPGPLALTNARGDDVVFDLDVVTADEASCAALSIRISEEGVVQSDCLLGKQTVPTPDDFRMGNVLGLRLQPFFLPDFGTATPETRGRGLFDRGLHYSGIVTPGNVSLLCRCDQCATTFRLQSFHCGFAGQGYFYCGSGIHTLAVPSQVPGSPPVRAQPDPPLLAALEARLPPCRECGKGFRYLNPLRCPRCAAAYVDFETYPEMRLREYYGNVTYGGDLQRFE